MSVHRLNPAQETAVELQGHDLLVTAGAGTGKTTVLVERALYKLRSRAVDSLDQLLVVTFTDKAAKEMKNRLYREMLRDPALRRHLPQLPRAWISTIHGFCARLLRERFLEAGVEPGFRILSEHGREEALDDALRRVFHGWYSRSGQEEARRFISLVEMGGFDAEGEVLRRIVRSIYEFSRVTPDPDVYLDSLLSRPPATRLEELQWYRAMADALIGSTCYEAGCNGAIHPPDAQPHEDESAPRAQAAGDGGTAGKEEPGDADAQDAHSQGRSTEPPSDGLWIRALALYRAAVNLAEAKRPTKMRRLLELLEAVGTSDMRTSEGQRRLIDSLVAADLLDPGDALGQAIPKAPAGANRIPGFKQLHEAAKRLFRDAAISQLPWDEGTLLHEDRTQREFLEVLVRIVREVDHLYMQFKSRQGYLDFSDLEISAARLIRDYGESFGWRDRFTEVLVDEFQDVNPLQNGILSAFCRPDSGFRVGDVKQSIYQFRLADPTIFLAQTRSGRTTLKPDERPGGSDPVLLFLAENYRSRPEILTFVNHVFSDVFTEEVIGSSYTEQALQSGKARDSESAPVELHLLSHRVKPTESGRDGGGAEAGTDGEASAAGEETPAAGKETLAAGGEAPTGPGGTPTGYDTGDFDPPDRREAAFAALRIRRLITEEQPRIPVSKDETRPATYADVAILLRSRAKADLFLEALAEAGVPAFRQEGGSLVQEEGVRDLRTLLSLIDNPRDDVALAAVLRSPLVGVEDGDLVRIRLAWPRARTFLDAVAAVAYSDQPEDHAGVFIPPPPVAYGIAGHRTEAGAKAAVTPCPTGTTCVTQDTDHPNGTDRSGGTDQGTEGDPSARPAVHTSTRFWTGPPGDVPEDWIPGPLRDKLRAFMNRLAAWRLSQGRTELRRFLADVCRESGLESVLLGRPDSALQRAAVERFLSLARAFEAERGSSLHGFLARISLQEATGTLDGVSRSQEGHNAVALLTVHKAKGLEYPIVVLPQLQWGFRRDSLGDRLRIGEQWIGLRELEFESWGRRDTWPRRTLELLQRRRQREEEARILYVALTRAQERLILVATPRSSFKPPEELPPPSVQHLLTREKCLTATSALDWILASIPWDERIPDSGSQDPAAPDSLCIRFRSLPLVLWSHPAFPTALSAQAREAEEEKMLEWRRNLLGGTSLEDEEPSLATDTDGRALHGETITADAELARVLAGISRQPQYPPLASLDDLKGKYWVTELKGPLDPAREGDLIQEGAGMWLPARSESPQGFTPGSDDPRTPAGLRGTVYHAALSRLDISAVSPGELDAQFSSMSREPWWEGVQRDSVIEAGISRFFVSDLGIRLRRAWETDSDSVEREAAFSLRLAVRELASLRTDLAAAIEADRRWSREPWAGALDNTWVLIQGRVDCVFLEQGAWTLIDWKTDRVSGAGLDPRAAFYADQMRIYSRAVERLWGPLSAAWLVFPVAGRAVAVTSD